MFRKNSHGLYESTLLSSFQGLVHGFTTRQHGDMRNPDAKLSLICEFYPSVSALVELNQIHSARVLIYSEHRGKEHHSADAILCVGWNKRPSYRQLPFLTVLTADCVPIVLFDPTLPSIAIVHAGWNGTLGNIACEIVKAMLRKGSNPGMIRVAIGPSIGPCCYSVKSDRARLFAEAFPKKSAVVEEEKNTYSLNLQNATLYQLVTVGILRQNIDVASLCTVCTPDEFFSFRRHNEKDFGKMMNFVGMMNDL